MTVGGYMLFDGVYVMIKGQYIGPPKPGPWSGLFRFMGVDVFSMGPVFILYGICWLVILYGLWSSRDWTFIAGLILAVATLWYIPFGTLISVVWILTLIFYRDRLGI